MERGGVHRGIVEIFRVEVIEHGVFEGGESDIEIGA